MNSVSQRLTISLIGVLVSLFGVFSVVMHFSGIRALEKQFDEMLRNKALPFLSRVEQLNGSVHVSIIRDPVRHPSWSDFSGLDAKSFLEIRGSNGEVVFRSGLDNSELLPLKSGPIEDPAFWDVRLEDGTLVRAIGIQFVPRLDQYQSEGADVVDATLIVATNRESLDASIVEQKVIMLSGAVVLLLSIAVVVPLILRRGLEPLMVLRDRGERIDAQSLSERFPLEGMPAELIPICHCLNKLLSRIEGSFEREHRFGSDVAHELCTPLAELRLLFDYHLKFPDADCRDCIEKSYVVLMKLEKVVTTLLELYRAEQLRGVSQNAPEIFLRPVIEEQWEKLNKKANDRGLTLRMDLDPRDGFPADEVLFASLLFNILENAVEYSDSNSEVHVSWQDSSERFQLRIANQASSLDQADIDRVFDRFWRKETARSESRHSGLGLALSREIARGMDLEIGATLDENGTFSIVITGKKTVG